jgi:hypothetical protein
MILRGDIASLKEKTLTLPSGFQTNDSAPEWVNPALHQAIDEAKGLWLSDRYDEAIAASRLLLERAKEERDYLAAGRSAELLHNAMCDWLIVHQNDPAHAVEWNRISGTLPDVRKQSVENFRNPDRYDSDAHSVSQDSIGFSDIEKVGTERVNQCLGLAIKNSETGKVGFAHISCETSEASIAQCLEAIGSSSAPLQARIFGAKVNGLNEEGAEKSHQNLEKVLRVLRDRGEVDLLSADVLDCRPDQPTVAVIDPPSFILTRKAPAIVPVEVELEGITARPDKPLTVSFDFTESPERNPVLLMPHFVEQLRGGAGKSDLELYAEMKEKTPRRWLENTTPGIETRFGLRIDSQQMLAEPLRTCAVDAGRGDGTFRACGKYALVCG